MNLDRLKDYVDGLSAEDKFEIVNGIEEYVYFEGNETFTVFMLTNDDYCEYGDTYPIDVVKEHIGDLYTIESIMGNYSEYDDIMDYIPSSLEKEGDYYTNGRNDYFIVEKIN